MTHDQGGQQAGNLLGEQYLAVPGTAWTPLTRQRMGRDLSGDYETPAPYRTRLHATDRKMLRLNGRAPLDHSVLLVYDPSILRATQIDNSMQKQCAA